MFSYEIYAVFKNTFLQNTSTLMAASGSKQCKPMERYTKSILPKKEMIYLNGTSKVSASDKEYSSEVFQTLLAVPHFSKVTGKSSKQKQSSGGVLQRRCF